MEPPVLPLSRVLPAGHRRVDRWVLEHRGPKNAMDPHLPYAFLSESEPGPDGDPVDVATVFLTNRECPWRCVMCDLWQDTLDESVPPGALAAQVEHALERLPQARWLKLYNAGSFFDPRAVPPDEYAALAALGAAFDRVIVECHPALVGVRCLEFQAELRRRGPGTRLEVAMGLETVHPEVLSRLNKRMTVDDFNRGASFLRQAGIDVRVFILVRPPWLTEEEGVSWACRSLDAAFDAGACVCTLIPTRGGNGAMELLAGAGEFAPPSLAALESCLEYGLSLRRGRVFVDLWDVERLARCPGCSPRRIERLSRMNREQKSTSRVDCRRCRRSEGARAG